MLCVIQWIRQFYYYPKSWNIEVIPSDAIWGVRKIIWLPGKIKELSKFIKWFFGFEVLGFFLLFWFWRGRVFVFFVCEFCCFCFIGYLQEEEGMLFVLLYPSITAAHIHLWKESCFHNYLLSLQCIWVASSFSNKWRCLQFHPAR